MYSIWGSQIQSCIHEDQLICFETVSFLVLPFLAAKPGTGNYMGTGGRWKTSSRVSVATTTNVISTSLGDVFVQRLWVEDSHGQPSQVLGWCPGSWGTICNSRIPWPNTHWHLRRFSTVGNCISGGENHMHLHESGHFSPQSCTVQ